VLNVCVSDFHGVMREAQMAQFAINCVCVCARVRVRMCTCACACVRACLWQRRREAVCYSVLQSWQCLSRLQCVAAHYTVL